MAPPQEGGEERLLQLSQGAGALTATRSSNSLRAQKQPPNATKQRAEKAVLPYRKYDKQPDPQSLTKVRSARGPASNSGIMGQPCAGACIAAQPRLTPPCTRTHRVRAQKVPSQLIQQLTAPATHVNGWRPKPKILELLNLADHSHQVRVRQLPSDADCVCRHSRGRAPRPSSGAGSGLPAGAQWSSQQCSATRVGCASAGSRGRSQRRRRACRTIKRRACREDLTLQRQRRATAGTALPGQQLTSQSNSGPGGQCGQQHATPAAGTRAGAPPTCLRTRQLAQQRACVTSLSCVVVGPRTHITNAQVTSSVPVGEPIFQPFPPEVTFYGYEAFKEYEALLCLRNNDDVSLRLPPVPGSGRGS